MSESFDISFYSDCCLDNREFVDRGLNIFLKHGFSLQDPEDNMVHFIQLDKYPPGKSIKTDYKGVVNELSEGIYYSLCIYFESCQTTLAFGLTRKLRGINVYGQSLYLEGYATHGYFGIVTGWTKKRTENLLSVFRALIDLMKPFYAYGKSSYETGEFELRYINDQDCLNTMRQKAYEGELMGIFWFNFFGKKIVTKYCRERLLSAPSWKTEELSDGGIMLVRSPNPFTIDEPYIKAEVIEEYLGIKG